MADMEKAWEKRLAEARKENEVLLCWNYVDIFMYHINFNVISIVYCTDRVIIKAIINSVKSRRQKLVITVLWHNGMFRDVSCYWGKNSEEKTKWKQHYKMLNNLIEQVKWKAEDNGLRRMDFKFAVRCHT